MGVDYPRYEQRLDGKTGLIVGVANKRSIAWAIAQAAARAGARLAVTYQGERLEENVRELAAGLTDPLILPCDVSDDAQIDAVFMRRSSATSAASTSSCTAPRSRRARSSPAPVRADHRARASGSRSTSARIR